MSVLDILLNSDMAKINKPTREVEIKRLSGSLGQKVIFKCEALTSDKMQHIQEMCADKNGDINIVEMRILTLIEGVAEPSLKNKELLIKFGAATPKELLNKNIFLLPGEINSLYNVISELSGFDDDAVEEIKNS